MKTLTTAGPVTALLAAGALVLGAPPAAAAGEEVVVFPASAAPGEGVTVKSSCEGPAERLEFTSAAFAGPAEAPLVNTFGSTTARVRGDARPGAYTVTGTCTGGSATGRETVEGTVTVTDGPTPSGAPQTGGGGTADRGVGAGAADAARGPTGAAVGVLAALALLGAVVHRRLRRNAG
ncbi:hypothetical protein [Nocardiopsis suaedae]|uniref:Uncharacterized protein n=1 Tax=Nocardiopsis suaedae TaxID=3018444 RepID=A0ABT4TFM5_9ACTN|nr:hypothetical protein [Nocardiopsis suaedae]MDA2803104.1 hypothetical protein [Nocardiopsis suaedae]